MSSLIMVWSRNAGVIAADSRITITGKSGQGPGSRLVADVEDKIFPLRNLPAVVAYAGLAVIDGRMISDRLRQFASTFSARVSDASELLDAVTCHLHGDFRGTVSALRRVFLIGVTISNDGLTVACLKNGQCRTVRKGRGVVSSDRSWLIGLRLLPWRAPRQMVAAAERRIHVMAARNYLVGGCLNTLWMDATGIRWLRRNPCAIRLPTIQDWLLAATRGEFRVEATERRKCMRCSPGVMCQGKSQR